MRQPLECFTLCMNIVRPDMSSMSFLHVYAANELKATQKLTVVTPEMHR